MVLAILLGGIFGLLVAGGVLVAGTIKQARRDQDDINHAFAEARGEKHDPVIGPAPWSSIDMEALVEEGVAVDRSDPYATLTGSTAFVSWSHSTEASDGDDTPSLDDEPATQLTHEPEETFVAGQSFVDRASYHRIVRNASDTKPMKFLIAYTVKKGEPNTVFPKT